MNNKHIKERLRNRMPHNYSRRHYYLKHARQPYVGGEPLPRCNSLAGHVRHGLARLTTPDVETIPTNMLGWRLLSAKVSVVTSEQVKTNKSSKSNNEPVTVHVDPPLKTSP